jgi:hypothetical protein
MPKVECPNCSARLDAPTEYAGRKARCNKCGRPFAIRFDAEPGPDTFDVAELEHAFDDVHVSLPADRLAKTPASLARYAVRTAPTATDKPIDAFGLAALGIAVALIAFVPTLAVPAGAAVCMPFLAIGIGRAVDHRRLQEIVVTTVTVVLLGVGIGLYYRAESKAADEAAQPALKVQESLDSIRNLVLPPSSRARRGF